MKKLAVLLAVLVSAFALTACGSNSKKEVTPDTVVAALDEVCTDTAVDFESLGTRGVTMPAIASEFEGYAEARQAVVDGFKEIDANTDAQATIDEYVAASEKVIASDQAIAEAAADGDNAAMNKAFAEQADAFKARDKVAKQVGTEVCGQTVEIKVEPTGTAPPDDLNYAEPTNTIEEVADQYVKTSASGDCDAINQGRHTDAGDLPAENCKAAATALAGAKVAGTETYGPVAQAEVVAKDGTHYPTYFVTDLDDKLRYAGDTIHDSGGLRPAPEGNDAEATADATVAAIRDSDIEAFNATLPEKESPFWIDGENFETFGGGKFAKDFVADIRDTDVEPVQLGLNSTWGFYFVEGSEYDWVMAMVHIPGIGGHYRFGGYYPIPKAE